MKKLLAFALCLLAFPALADAPNISGTGAVPNTASSYEIESGTGKSITSVYGTHTPTANASWSLTNGARNHEFIQAPTNAYTITITPPSGSYVAASDNTVYCTQSHAIKSSGAVSESISYLQIDATHWISKGFHGAWACQ